MSHQIRVRPIEALMLYKTNKSIAECDNKCRTPFISLRLEDSRFFYRVKKSKEL